MGKVAPDSMIDSSLDYVAKGDKFLICSGSPSNYATAISASLVQIACTSGSYFVKADDTSGRKITMQAVNGASIVSSGFAEAVAIVSAASSLMLYCTTCTGQSLVAGGTVDVPA